MQLIKEMKIGDTAYIPAENLLRHTSGGIWVHKCSITLPACSKKVPVRVERASNGYLCDALIKEGKLALLTGSTKNYIELMMVKR